MATVELRKVALVVGDRALVDDVDLLVPSGSLAVVVGPSGCGKTSLLRLVAGLTVPTSGEVLIDGRPVDHKTLSANRVSMAFQDDPLYEHLDVSANLGFALRVRRVDRDEVERRTRDTAGRVGIHRLLGRRPATLSGGERSRVAIGRALVPEETRVLLLDEPLARADRRMRLRFRREIRRVHEEAGVTTILATNDQEEALAVADLLVVMDAGRVRQAGAPRQVLEDPADLEVAGFVGDPPMNLFPAEVEGGELVVGNDRLRLRVEAPAGRVVAGIRPEHLRLAGPATPFDRVLHVTAGPVEDTGRVAVVHFGLGAVGSVAYSLLVDSAAGIEPGQRLELTWDPDRLRLFRR